MESMYRALFADQDSLGLKPYSRYAVEAEMSDSATFESCMRAPAPFQIAEDLEMGERLGVKGTPTLVVNGWLLSIPPTDMEFEKIVAASRDGRQWSPRGGDTVAIDLLGAMRSR